MKEEYDIEELNVALNLSKNINQGALLARDLPSINRIIKIYFSFRQKNPKEEKQVIDFLFNCLDLYGKKASVLFSHCKSKHYRSYIIDRLYCKYEDIFDFNYINHSLFENSVEMKQTFKRKITIRNIIIIFLIILISYLYFQKKNVEKQFVESQQINKIIQNKNDELIENMKENIKIIKDLNNTQNKQNSLILKLNSSIKNTEQKIDELNIIIEYQKESDKKRNIYVAYIVPDGFLKNTIDIGFINDLNSRDIQIHIRKIEFNFFTEIINSNKTFIKMFDVLMLGIEGYTLYTSVNDYFLLLLTEYRNDGGHLLFLHDFNSGPRSAYKKTYQPFSDDLGFRGIREGNIFTKCKFINSEIHMIQLFPFVIQKEFNIAETHETPMYDPKYTVIAASNNHEIHYYSENTLKRIGDCSMGHNIHISLNEKKLLYNILYHLSQLP